MQFCVRKGPWKIFSETHEEGNEQVFAPLVYFFSSGNFGVSSPPVVQNVQEPSLENILLPYGKSNIIV